MNRGIVTGRALAIPRAIGTALALPRRAGGIVTGRVLVIPLFLLLMEVAVRAGLVSPFFVAAPSTFLPALVTYLAEGDLLRSLATTLQAVGMAFLLCSVVGITVGYLMWRLPTMGLAYETLLGGLMAAPTILLFPVFLIFFGRTMTAIVLLNALHSTIPILLNTRQALVEVSPTLMKVGRSMNLSERQMFRHILIPAALPFIFAGLRLGLIYMLLGIIAVEYIVELGGLGMFISDMAFRFENPGLYAGIAMVFLLSVVVMHLLGMAQRAIR